MATVVAADAGGHLGRGLLVAVEHGDPRRRARRAGRRRRAPMPLAPPVTSGPAAVEGGAGGVMTGVGHARRYDAPRAEPCVDNPQIVAETCASSPTGHGQVRSRCTRSASWRSRPRSGSRQPRARAARRPGPAAGRPCSGGRGGRSAVSLSRPPAGEPRLEGRRRRLVPRCGVVRQHRPERRLDEAVELLGPVLPEQQPGQAEPGGVAHLAGPAEREQGVEAAARLGVRRGQVVRTLATATPTVAVATGRARAPPGRERPRGRGVVAGHEQHDGARGTHRPGRALGRARRASIRTAACRSAPRVRRPRRPSGGSRVTPLPPGPVAQAQVGGVARRRGHRAARRRGGPRSRRRCGRRAAPARSRCAPRSRVRRSGQGERPGRSCEDQRGDVLGAGQRGRDVRPVDRRRERPDATDSAHRGCQARVADGLTREQVAVGVVDGEAPPSTSASTVGDLVDAAPVQQQVGEPVVGDAPRSRRPRRARSPVRLACVELGEEPGVLQRDRRMGGERRQQADLGRRERADRPVHGEQGPDARARRATSGTPRIARICSPATASSM